MAPTDKVVRDVGARLRSDDEVAILWRSIMTGRDPLLEEREKTHGSFADNAEIFSKFLGCLRYEQKVNDAQRLAIMMIFLKIARIHSGQAMTKDHWDDIAGYAKLGSEACE